MFLVCFPAGILRRRIVGERVRIYRSLVGARRGGRRGKCLGSGEAIALVPRLECCYFDLSSFEDALLYIELTGNEVVSLC